MNVNCNSDKNGYFIKSIVSVIIFAPFRIRCLHANVLMAPISYELHKYLSSLVGSSFMVSLNQLLQNS
jgi:hypothetical protein